MANTGNTDDQSIFSTALQHFIDGLDPADRNALYSVLSLDDENGIKSNNAQRLTQVCIDLSSCLMSKGLAPIMPQHHVDRAQQADALPKFPSWAYDLRLPFHTSMPESSILDTKPCFNAEVQADGSLIAKLHYVGVIGEVNITRSWFELLATPSVDNRQVPETGSEEDLDEDFDDRYISIGSSSVHTMELKGGTSLLKSGDLLFSSQQQCFAGGGLFFLRRGSHTRDYMQLIYSRASEEVQRRGDRRNIDPRTTHKHKFRVRIG
ncbi:hypothetical protein Slin14017_G087590 [Septoria linicola]|nr:hypothetical protein Slin14017_G087590 [Septoria linicola]